MSSNYPPVLPGLPLLGNALEFRRDPQGLFQRGYEKYGSIFTIKLGRKPAVVLVGPENGKFFFEQTDKSLSMREVYQFLIPMFGEDIFFAAGPDTYREQRNIMLPAFSGKKMPAYTRVMVKETESWLDSLGDQGRFDLVSTFEKLTMYIAAAAFLGEDFRRRLGDEFAVLYRQLGEGIEYLLPTNLPIPRFKRRDRAKAQLEKMIGKIIAERLANPGSYEDFLQSFLDATYSDGSKPPERVITSLVLGMVFAGHETTAGHASWGLVQLLQHPDYLEGVIAEIDENLSEGDEVDLDLTRKLEKLEWALKETERMRPVAGLLMRYNAEDYELGGYHIPQGWLTVYAIGLSHRLDEIYTLPDVYDPNRFGPERQEHRAHPNSLAGFGGGRHKCLGMNFAYLEMIVIFTLLLQRYHLELLDPRPTADPTANTSRPRRPCWVSYKPR
ncbi:MAG: cytochrome P450 [Anaerolineales bacterium]